MLQKQVQWRVADSVKAGLHPLAALGMAPANVGGQWAGTDFGSMGQDIGRAAEALATPQDKVGAQLMRLQIERGGLENELLRTQIASQRAQIAQMGTPGVSGNAAHMMPISGTRTPVSDPGLAERVQRDWGELGEWIYGGAAFANDHFKAYGNQTAMAYANEVGARVRAWLASLGKLRSVHGFDYNYASGGR